MEFLRVLLGIKYYKQNNSIVVLNSEFSFS